MRRNFFFVFRVQFASRSLVGLGCVVERKISYEIFPLTAINNN